MRKIKRLLALIYFLSIFMGVAHEISHVHHLDDNCSVCVLSHTPAVGVDAPSLISIDKTYAEFISLPQNKAQPCLIQARSRAPPLA
jgi:hypothetical protein